MAEENNSRTETIETECVTADAPSTVCSFYLEGKCRFGSECFNIHEGDIPQDKVKRKNDSQNSPEHLEKETGSLKKPSLRTAGDVRKRIQWDTALPEEYFTVGYLDRFDGVVEKPFTYFTWEHLATVDQEQLAIPQHRIQYYKYKGKKVWGKSERLDLVFGSGAGSSETIFEVMAQVDAELSKIPPFFEDDSSDEDVVVIGSTLNSEVVESVIETQLLRATHFLCIRIENPDLARAVKEVQDHVVSQDPMLRSCTMPTEILHITLCMVKCPTPESIEKVTEIMRDFEKEIHDWSEDKNSNKIIAEHLSTFGSRVLYSKLNVPKSFTISVRYLQERLRKTEGVTITNHFDFVPHMTLIKIGRKVAKERRSKYINSVCYSDYFDKHFGEIVFDNLYFCEINDERGHDGFYRTIHKIKF